MNHGFAIWLTGLPASGKSSIAREVLALLQTFNIGAIHLESDQLRKELTPSPKYSVEERDSLYRTIGLIVRILTENGLNVLIDATGNKRAYRDQVRALIPRFLEAYVRCPLDVCIARDPKGIYRNARKGGTVPGLQEVYEEPAKPGVLVDSDRTPVDECARIIINKLQKLRWI